MSFQNAISGLRAASNDLDVTTNNVANANTTGFKQSRAEFADVYAVSNLRTGSTAIGAGVQTSRVAQQFTQGGITFTDNALDMAINGQGFFVVDDGGTPVYTRAGAFGLDKSGNMVDAFNRKLTGFLADSNGNITGASGALQINQSDIQPKQTANVALDLNLDSGSPLHAVGSFNVNDTTTFDHSTSTTIFDSLGNGHLISFYFQKVAETAGASDWRSFTFVDGNNVTATATGEALSFDGTGALTAPPGGLVTTGTISPGTGANNFTVTLNYSNTTQFGSPFAVSGLTQDGFTTGRLSGLDVDEQGVILARFTNGQSRVEGQIALANFKNPQGLQPVSDSTWAETFSSGAALVGAPGTSTLGLIQSGALEDSNVDLSAELVRLIIAQRNFEANAESIRATDSTTQAIINL